MMNPESEKAPSSDEFTQDSQSKDQVEEKQVNDVVFVANVIEASKDGEVVKYTIQTKEVSIHIHLLIIQYHLSHLFITCLDEELSQEG